MGACAVALGGGGASASSAGNSSQYSDPAGDNQTESPTNYAADIRQVSVTSQDNGTVHISVTLADADASLVEGDQLDVYIDYDQNRNTGQSGFDLDLSATGRSSGGTTFALCRLGQLTSCEQGPSGWAHDQPSGAGMHVVDFFITTGVPAFDFGVVEAYSEPGGSTRLTDIAPNSGLFTFETNADPDNDGLYGTSDKCPTVRARGKYDSNKNGCPGPFKFIRAQAHFAGIASRKRVRLTELRVTGASPGAVVSFSSSRGHDRVRAKSSGVARSKRVLGKYRYGSVIKIRITKSGFVGELLTEVVRKRGLKLVRKTCIPATGKQKPVKCSGKLKGS